MEISGKCLVRHIPRKISRLCNLFLDYGGRINAVVTFNKIRRLPFPQGGLEIPGRLVIPLTDTSNEAFLSK